MLRTIAQKALCQRSDKHVGLFVQISGAATKVVSTLHYPFPATYIPERTELPPFPKDFKEHPDRDLVNFPHPELKLFPSKMRLGIIPDSWFQFFYNKTGVTGPYVFGTGVTLFLFQKEILMVDEEYHKTLYLIGLFYLIYKCLAPKLEKSYFARGDDSVAELYAWKDLQLSASKDAIAQELKHQEQYTYVVEKMHEAKKENVILQLEHAYRQRLHTAYSEVKRRLDYAVEVESAKLRFQQRYMVDWIVSQVRKSISEKQEKAALQQCIFDLKALAVGK